MPVASTYGRGYSEGTMDKIKFQISYARKEAEALKKELAAEREKSGDALTEDVLKLEKSLSRTVGKIMGLTLALQA